jgi:uncharacterized protein YdhG (YjbR/CyaY superfamily)
MDKTVYQNIDQYHAAFSAALQIRMQSIRKIMHSVAPNVDESIRYNMPAFKVGKHHLYYAAYKKHIGFYPVYNLPGLDKELAPYRAKKTKDSLHFLHQEKLPLALIKKIVIEKSKVK